MSLSVERSTPSRRRSPRGEDVSIVGFGRSSRKGRPAREGRNPRAGERIAFGPSAGVSFKAGKPLKDSLS